MIELAKDKRLSINSNEENIL